MVVDTIVEQEDVSKWFFQMYHYVKNDPYVNLMIVKSLQIYNRPTVFLYLIDKVWANDGAQYFLIATLLHKDDQVQSNSGNFTTVDHKKSSKDY